MPDTNQTIGFEREANWSFPVGTIWIKHFELELTSGVPSSARRIETRFLVRTTAGVYGVTYRWDDSQTNATLVATDGLDEDIDVEDQGETHTHVWHYPGRSECLRCHQEVAGFALGFNTPQLNRDFDYGGTTNNQIAALSQAGYFSRNITSIHTLRAPASATNTAWSLEYRVRSYLAANCSQCHQPGTDCLAVRDARIFAPTDAAGIIDGRLVFAQIEVPGGRVLTPGSLDRSMMLYNIANLKMPPLATTVVNAQALQLLSNGLPTDWPITKVWPIGSAPLSAQPISLPPPPMRTRTGTAPATGLNT